MQHKTGLKPSTHIHILLEAPSSLEVPCVTLSWRTLFSCLALVFPFHVGFYKAVSSLFLLSMPTDTKSYLQP